MMNRKVFTLILIIYILLNEGNAQHKNIDVNDYNSDIIVSWNKLVLSLAVEEDGLLTLKGVRTLSMMHIAIHDALNSVKPLYSSYAFNTPEPVANVIAAVNQAAYSVAIDQYPKNQKRLNMEYQRWMNQLKDTQRKIDGIELGKKSAAKILAKRLNDKWNDEAEYMWHPMAPGVYAEFHEHSKTPQGFIFGAGWAKVKPFMLETQDQFRSPPPPEINSNSYTKAFNEVKEVGGFESKKRTNDQSHFAMWWKDFAENSHNRLARDLTVKENLNLWDAARLFALLNMSICDAYINVFDNKFHFNHWRPYTAIRWAANDGNPDTKPDTSWNNLHKHTYAFPSYPSAHGCASAAAMTIFENVFGESYHFTMRIPEVDRAGPMSGKIKTNPSTRSFDNFMQAAMECAMSRVYLGIHFRYDSEEGYNLGKRTGAYAVNNFLNKID